MLERKNSQDLESDGQVPSLPNALALLSSEAEALLRRAASSGEIGEQELSKILKNLEAARLHAREAAQTLSEITDTPSPYPNNVQEPAPIDPSLHNNTHPSVAPKPIQPNEIKIVAKRSSLERKADEAGIPAEELCELYLNSGKVSKVAEANGYLRQKESFKILLETFPEATVFRRDDLQYKEYFQGAKAVISFGGDDFLGDVTQVCHGDTLVIGINSDRHPDGSVGYLLPYAADDLKDLRESLIQADYRVEPWTRVEVEIDGVPVGSAVNEVYVGELINPEMSGHIFSKGDGYSVKQRGSGLLVTTGTGSTSWADVAQNGLRYRAEPFPKDAKLARFIPRELKRTSLVTERNTQGPVPEVSQFDLEQGILTPGEWLHLISLNDSDGIIALDSKLRFPFPKGMQARIRLSEDSVLTVQPNRHPKA